MISQIELPKIGQAFSNNEIMAIFKCKNSGGIRYSTTTKTIVLIANHNYPLYHDRSTNVEDIFLYTGEGQEGDQNMTRGNKRLRDSKKDRITVHLFEHFPNVSGYIYGGPVELDGEPYQEVQPDMTGNPRKVYIFPLRFIK